MSISLYTGLAPDSVECKFFKIEYDNTPGTGMVHLEPLDVFVLFWVIHQGFHIRPINQSLDLPLSQLQARIT